MTNECRNKPIFLIETADLTIELCVLPGVTNHFNKKCEHGQKLTKLTPVLRMTNDYITNLFSLLRTSI